VANSKLITWTIHRRFTSVYTRKDGWLKLEVHIHCDENSENWVTVYLISSLVQCLRLLAGLYNITPLHTAQELGQ